MATISLRTNRGDVDYQVVSANPGTDTTSSDIEVNISVGLTPRWSSAELIDALRRFERYLESHGEFWQGL